MAGVASAELNKRCVFAMSFIVFTLHLFIYLFLLRNKMEKTKKEREMVSLACESVFVYQVQQLKFRRTPGSAFFDNSVSTFLHIFAPDPHSSCKLSLPFPFFASTFCFGFHSQHLGVDSLLNKYAGLALELASRRFVNVTLFYCLGFVLL